MLLIKFLFFIIIFQFLTSLVIQLSQYFQYFLLIILNPVCIYYQQRYIRND